MSNDDSHDPSQTRTWLACLNLLPVVPVKRRAAPASAGKRKRSDSQHGSDSRRENAFLRLEAYISSLSVCLSLGRQCSRVSYRRLLAAVGARPRGCTNAWSPIDAAVPRERETTVIVGKLQHDNRDTDALLRGRRAFSEHQVLRPTCWPV
jgi:hypothetical protein